MYFTISYCFHFNVLLIIKFIVTMHSYMFEFIYVFITWTISAVSCPWAANHILEICRFSNRETMKKSQSQKKTFNY